MADYFRQHPGSACEECRRRKARCDRSRPCCGSCSEAGRLCIFSDQRAQRGPKKGQIRALRDRINTLERLLSEQQPLEESFTTAIDPAVTGQLIESPDITNIGIPPLWEFDANFPMAIEPLSPEMREAPGETGLTWKSNRKVIQPSDEGQISALVQEDAYVAFEIPYAGYSD
ncbi:hypothetical protein Asppvi_010385 [Aspergillus pseudoviridinutans]|uniref:Zn(2)-C6 fungal-type domain-containing protein n=1 Tax=Aspergillus pseudoviridinutans TaxID=1517512 RepID=A0A9P3F015_9EURO|nr:uncharacterized protein Asppvi_010385 [Aspergillus pseudoviridinutans]GIJ91420.1 hypothetical protein Asppvi_010385 [Aspergillus pseudoviridinutans]